MEKGEDEVNQGAILSPRREDFFLGEKQSERSVEELNNELFDNQQKKEIVIPS